MAYLESLDWGGKIANLTFFLFGLNINHLYNFFLLPTKQIYKLAERNSLYILLLSQGDEELKLWIIPIQLDKYYVSNTFLSLVSILLFVFLFVTLFTFLFNYFTLNDGLLSNCLRESLCEHKVVF